MTASTVVRAESYQWDLLITLAAPPFDSDVVTTVLRLLDATLRRGAKVQVWTCGYATALTQRSLGELKPPDVLSRRGVFPSTAAVIGELLDTNPESLAWQVCRFCAEDRGALDHIDGVRIRSFGRFSRRVAASATTIYIGGS
jgi:hypothetical protein